jgi:hypothetical protein
MAPPAAAGAAAVATGAAAVLSDEQAAEQDLEEVSVFSAKLNLQLQLGAKAQPPAAAGRLPLQYGQSSRACGEVAMAAQVLMVAVAALLLLLLQWHCIESGGWPFQRLADQLCCDVLSPVWTVRHGAAAGLRELLREQAAAAAVEVPLDSINSGWACAGNSGK